MSSDILNQSQGEPRSSILDKGAFEPTTWAWAWAIIYYMAEIDYRRRKEYRPNSHFLSPWQSYKQRRNDSSESHTIKGH